MHIKRIIDKEEKLTGVELAVRDKWWLLHLARDNLVTLHKPWWWHWMCHTTRYNEV